MHRIDADDAAGLFKTSPLPATIVTPAWANDVQENIVQVIEAAEIALIKGDGAQLLEAIQALDVAATAAANAYTDDAAADIIASLDDQGSNANGWWRRNPDGTIDQWGVYNGNSPHPGI
ncbi:hypothetical protein, partial [Reyranella sp.]|uniref:hypothetical protein n=1 Tax=Reyranella sp. TaxID=1929291 RepID=UPI0027311681